jgi:hypothetical protein
MEKSGNVRGYVLWMQDVRTGVRRGPHVKKSLDSMRCNSRHAANDFQRKNQDSGRSRN